MPPRNLEAVPENGGRRRPSPLDPTLRGISDESDSLVSLAPGTRVGRYEIAGVLGAGGMGTIYRARDPYFSRDVALKLLHQYRHHLPDAAEYQARLVREAQALGKLSHPNVVAAHDVGLHEGAVFIAMELVVGVSLAAWLDRHRRDRAEVVRVLVAAGRGLAAAHDAGVLHRDFKPANVMVSPDGRVRVVDFGLARSTHEPAPAAEGSPGYAAGLGQPAGELGDPLRTGDITQTGTLMGTVGFMAPEQLIGDVCDARADQFAYAATAYYALVGSLPFPGRTIDEYHAALVRGVRPPWPPSVRRFRRVVERGLARRGEERYPSVGDMADALERAARPRRGMLTAAGIAGAAAAAGVAVLLGLPALTGDDTPRRSCAVDASELAGVWDGAARTAIERAFRATGHAQAGPSFERVAAHLDDFRSRWLAMRRASCEATHVRREQSVPVLEARTACLDRKRAQMGGLVKLLTEADGRLVDRAAGAVLQIGETESCADVRALMGEAEKLPVDPHRRAEIIEIEAGLDGAATARSAGRWPEGLAQAEQLLERAERAGYKPTLARATFEVAILRGNMGRPDADEAYQRALALASEAGLTAKTATIATALLHRTTNAGRWRDAELILPMIEAAVRQAGDPVEDRIELLIGHGLILLAKGEYAAALAKLETAAAECEKLGERGPSKRLKVDNEIARTLVEKGDRAAAARKIAEVIEETRRVNGPNHPRVIMGYSNLASVLVEARDHQGALAALAEAKKLAGDLPRTLPWLIELGALEGRVWQDSGDCARAVPFFREALERFTALGDAQADATTSTSQYLGQCLVQLGRVAEAIPHLEEWAKGRRAQGRRPDWQAQADFALARALWADAEPKRGARRRAERKRAVQLARGSLELYREAGDDVAAAAREVERWLASRRAAQTGRRGRLRGREMR